MTSINFIGAGRVGKTLGKLIARLRGYEILGICNTNAHSSLQAARFIGKGRPYHLHDLPYADITFVTAPDDQIPLLAQSLLNANVIQAKSIIIHCSGTLASQALAPLKILSCSLCSAHPIKSFADPQSSAKTFKNTYCALEGDERAMLAAQILFDELGAQTFKLRHSMKAKYHAGLVFAANYLVTLFEQSTRCLSDAGIDKEDAINISLSLMQDALSNIENSRCTKNALTGPLKRGDVNTIKEHIKAFDNKKMQALYCAMATATLPLTDHENNTEISSLLDLK